MIRFIVKRMCRDRASGAEWVQYETHDASVPSLEAALLGGTDVDAYDIPTLIGVEHLVATTEQPQ